MSGDPISRDAETLIVLAGKPNLDGGLLNGALL